MQKSRIFYRFYAFWRFTLDSAKSYISGRLEKSMLCIGLESVDFKYAMQSLIFGKISFLYVLALQGLFPARFNLNPAESNLKKL